MLAGELKFFKAEKLIKQIDNDEYDGFSKPELEQFVEKIALKIGATKVIENVVCHNHTLGVDTVIYLKNKLL